MLKQFTRLACIIALVSTPLAQADWGDLLKKGEQLIQKQSSTSTSDGKPSNLDGATLASGLKEALSVGGARAIEQLAANGGYANHPDVRIPMPGALNSISGLMRTYGLSAQVDAFESSMNEAAEEAISEASPIVMTAVEEMTLEDAQRIYSGSSDAATQYFEEKTRGPLATKLQPLIDQAISNTGVMQAYQALVGEAENQVPALQGLSPDIPEHVTEAALDGLFLRLAQEEKKIREQPIARSTELLKTVFGS